MSLPEEFRTQAEEVAKELGRFTQAEFADRSGFDPRRAREAVCWLQGRNVIFALSGTKKARVYALKDADALFGADKKLRRTPEGLMWQSIRVIRRFSVDDLEATMAAAEDEITPPSKRKIQRYCTALASAKVLKVTRYASGTNRARYQLVDDLGPLPPKLQKVELLFDQNAKSFLGKDKLA